MVGNVLLNAYMCLTFPIFYQLQPEVEAIISEDVVEVVIEGVDADSNIDDKLPSSNIYLDYPIITPKMYLSVIIFINITDVHRYV